MSLLGAPEVGRLSTTNPDAYDLYLRARKERATYSYGGLRAAEDLLKGALLIDPDFVDAKTELAMLYFHQVETGLMSPEGAFAEIIAITDQVLETRPDDLVAISASIFANAAVRTTEGDTSVIPELIRELEKIVAATPREWQPRILLVRAYQGLQKNDEAVRALEDALHQDPFNPSLHYELGTAYMRLQRWDDARVSLEKSLEIEPLQPNAYTNLGTISLQLGDGVGFVQQFLNAINVDPRDHELPGILAAFLYQLGLVDEADDFRARVQALAPTSAIGYRIELLRAISLGDEAASVASARRAIEDDVDDRLLAYNGAVRHLLRNAVRTDTIEQEIAWISERAPGIFDIEASLVPQKFRRAQGVAFSAWYVSLPREEVLRRLDLMLEYGASFGLDATTNPVNHLNILALRGDTEAAIEVALERVFNRPVTTDLGWRDNFAQAHFTEITTDPRVQAALQRWEAEEGGLRRQVRSYFADLDSAG